MDQLILNGSWPDFILSDIVDAALLIERAGGNLRTRFARRSASID
jgi:hypothetical protein